MVDKRRFLRPARALRVLLSTSRRHPKRTTLAVGGASGVAVVIGVLLVALLPTAAAPTPQPKPEIFESQWVEPVVQQPPAAPVTPIPRERIEAIATQGVQDIPGRVLAAYRSAAKKHGRSCGVRWQLLAGIGYIESGHAKSAGSTRRSWSGLARPPIYGPILNGEGFAAIRDTDNGALDANAQWDRAVGPMQFIPATWRMVGTDANKDGEQDPQHIDDATASSARYLCRVGVNTRTSRGIVTAVFAYNHSLEYVRNVLLVVVRYGDPGGVARRALATLPDPEPSPSPSPSVSPTPAAAASSPAASSRPTTSQPSPSPSARTTSPGPTATASPSSAPKPSDSPTPAPSPSPSPSPTDEPSPSPSAEPSPEQSPSEQP